MTALTVALVTFALVFGGALLGMYFRKVLSEDHLREDVRDVIKLSTGLIGTMAALVLGLLIASAKSTFDMKVLRSNRSPPTSSFSISNLSSMARTRKRTHCAA